MSLSSGATKIFSSRCGASGLQYARCVSHDQAVGTGCRTRWNDAYAAGKATEEKRLRAPRGMTAFEIALGSESLLDHLHMFQDRFRQDGRQVRRVAGAKHLARCVVDVQRLVRYLDGIAPDCAQRVREPLRAAAAGGKDEGGVIHSRTILAAPVC